MKFWHHRLWKVGSDSPPWIYIPAKVNEKMKRKKKLENKWNGMERNRIEGTFKSHLVELPDHLRDNQKLNHIIEDTVQMPLEQWQAWGFNHLARRRVSFDCLHGEVGRNLACFISDLTILRVHSQHS